MTETGSSYNPKTVRYLPALDSIRGLAFVFVFFFHTLHINNAGNWPGSFMTYLYQHFFWGLDVFFVLSSFLLTWLGLKEYDKKKVFSLKYYFVRRILRIWPLYFMILICAFLLFPLIADRAGFSMTLPNPWAYIFFIANFYHVPHVFFLAFLWTISVEEQFYFVWGFVLKFFKKHIGLIIAIFVVVSLFFGIFQTLRQKGIYSNTLLYLFNFACGAFAAMVFFNDNSRIRRWIEGMGKFKTLVFYSFLPIQFFFFFSVSRYFSGVQADLIDLLARYVFVVYISLLLIEQIVNRSRCKMLEKDKGIIFTGKISYGLYCYHGITITFISSVVIPKVLPEVPSWISITAIFAINYLVAVLSYYYFELFFLKLKSKFR